jgi:transposase-like protein
MEERTEAGDMWDHTAIAADSKLLVSLVVGKRTQAQTRALVHDTKECLRPGHLPAIFTDAYEGYEAAILEAFDRR